MRFKKGNKSRSRKRSSKVSASVKRYVKHEIRTVEEPKFFQYLSAPTYTAVTWTGLSPAPYCVTAVQQGDSDNTRDGDRLRIFGLSFKYTWVYNPAFGVASTQNVLIMVFQWFPNTVPTTVSVLQTLPSANNFLVTEAAPFSYINWDNRQMFKVLYKKVHTVTYYQSAFTRDKMIKNFKFRNLQYSNGTTAGTNQIYVLVLSDTIAGSPPTVLFTTRLLYTDS